jgi:GNAT superfamily N-acetyltransferase
MTVAPPRGPITVRPATAADAGAVRDVALVAWRATYAELLGADAVERFLAIAYSPERVSVRIERDDLFVARAPGGDASGIDAFIESIVEDGHAHIVAFYARPEARGRGIGTVLLQRVIALYPGLDISADVLIGNALGEPFYVARGFEPGDLLDEEVGGRLTRERRWWLRATRSAAFEPVTSEKAGETTATG